MKKATNTPQPLHRARDVEDESDPSAEGWSPSSRMLDLIQNPACELRFDDSSFSKGEALLTKDGVQENHLVYPFNPNNKVVHVLPNFAEKLISLATQHGLPFFDDPTQPVNFSKDRKRPSRSTQIEIAQRLLKMIGTSNDIFEVSEHQKLWDRTLTAHGFNADVDSFIPLNKCMPKSHVMACEKLNEVFRDVVEEASSARFKKLVSRREQTAELRLKSVQTWLANAFDCHSRLLVLRIDFHFKKHLRSDLTPAQAKAWFQKFTRGLQDRTKLNKGYVGYAGVLEYGRDANYHIHSIFLYDAAIRNSAFHMTENLMNYWTEITDGLGYAFDCSRSKYAHLNLGIGEINYTNESALQELFHVVVPYICKRDKFFRVLPGKARGLMRSEIKKNSPAYRRKCLGRPRSSEIAPTLKRFAAPSAYCGTPKPRL